MILTLKQIFFEKQPSQFFQGMKITLPRFYSNGCNFRTSHLISSFRRKTPVGFYERFSNLYIEKQLVEIAIFLKNKVCLTDRKLVLNI